MGRKFGALPPLLGRVSWVPTPSNTMSLGPRPTSLPNGVLIHPAIWPQHYGPKIGGCAPLGGGVGSPSNRMWPGPRPTCMPSFILIHPTVLPQYTNVKDRTEQTGQDRQRYNSIRRTVLQTVAQKSKKWYYLSTHWLYGDVLLSNITFFILGDRL